MLKNVLPRLRENFQCCMRHQLNGDLFDVNFEADNVLGIVEAVRQLKSQQTVFSVA